MEAVLLSAYQQVSALHSTTGQEPSARARCSHDCGQVLTVSTHSSGYLCSLVWLSVFGVCHSAASHQSWPITHLPPPCSWRPPLAW